MAEAGDGSGHTPLTPEWTPAPRASHYPWQGDRPATSAPSINYTPLSISCFKQTIIWTKEKWIFCHFYFLSFDFKFSVTCWFGTGSKRI